jgi:hypothetical protein
LRWRRKKQIAAWTFDRRYETRRLMWITTSLTFLLDHSALAHRGGVFAAR